MEHDNTFLYSWLGRDSVLSDFHVSELYDFETSPEDVVLTVRPEKVDSEGKRLDPAVGLFKVLKLHKNFLHN